MFFAYRFMNLKDFQRPDLIQNDLISADTLRDIKVHPHLKFTLTPLNTNELLLRVFNLDDFLDRPTRRDDLNI